MATPPPTVQTPNHARTKISVIPVISPFKNWMGTIISPIAHMHSQNPINKMINQLRFGGMRDQVRLDHQSQRLERPKD
jgi:hypothetical protein